MWIIALAFLILFETIADIFSKEWSIRGGKYLWLGAIALYVIGNMFWLYSLKEGSGLARGSIIFSVVTAIIAAGLGVLWYEEVLTKIQLTGVFLGIISLALIFWPTT